MDRPCPVNHARIASLGCGTDLSFERLQRGHDPGTLRFHSSDQRCVGAFGSRSVGGQERRHCCGTLLGVGTYLKEQNPDVKIFAVEPPAGETVEGLRNLDDGYIPPVFDKWGGFDLLDGKSIVRPRESLEYTRKMAEVGIFSGISAGAALAGACKVANRIDEGVIVYIVCDSGWKYLSTGAWTLDLDEAAANAEKVIYF